MEQMGKVMIAVGGAIGLLGLVCFGLGRLFPNLRPGRLPGDIVVERPGMGFYVPITSMVIVSLVLTAILWLIGAVKR